MSSQIDLIASDGHKLQAYIAEPQGQPRASIVVVQEIFGVNSHIRSVADDYAAQGYSTITPALFDRVKPGIELSYTAEDSAVGMKAIQQIGIDNALLDVSAALHHAASRHHHKKVGVLGFCLGGTLAWLAATRWRPAAAVGYYGGQISRFAQEQPTCPVLLHFGALDQHIGLEERETIHRAHPEIPVFVYENAGHGFNCDQRKSFEPIAAALARSRTLEFFAAHL
jgi:carboxymethylenebutenolidase